MKPFLSKIADRLLEKFPDSMDQIAVVLPSKRSVVFLKYYLSKKINSPIFLPDFYSIEQFTEKLSGLQVLDNISLQFKLYSSYIKYPPKKIDSFGDFLKWSNVLLHDFNEIDRSLVNAKSIYSNLRNVKELERWSVEDWSLSEDNLSVIQSDYIGFFEGMLNWYNDFNSSLLKENLAYQGMAYKVATERINNINIKWSKVWFVGLNALTKSEQSIIDFLRKKDIARVFWDADDFYYNNPLHEAGGFLREQRNKWSEIDFKGVGNYFDKEKENFSVVSCPKNIAQAKVAAEVVKSFLAEDLDNSNTAIVLADELLLYPVLHSLPSEIKQLNITMGSPLKNTTLFSFIEVIFKLQIHLIKYKRNAFYYKDVIAVIEHPYFLKMISLDSILEFKRFIIKKNIVFVSKSNIDTYFKQDSIGEIIFSFWRNVGDSLIVFTKIIDDLRLLIVGKKGSIESEILAHFFKILIVLKKLVAENKFVIDIKTLQTVMQQLVAKEAIPFMGEPLKGVQVMGILETRTLDFKNVIMLSVNEGKFPKGKSVNSFIPYDMKRYFNLPTYTESDAVFAYHFYRLLQRAKNVTLIYNTETDDDFGGGEKSRFITQLLSEYTGEINELVYKGEELEKTGSNSIIIKNKGLTKDIKSWAEKGVSPSALNTYNNCSLKFYYHYLAKIRVDDEVDEYADASNIGTAVHYALDKYYPLGLLTQKFIKENSTVILSGIRENFIQELSEKSIQEGKNYLSLKIAQKLTSDFLDLEIELLKKANAINSQIKIIYKEELLCHPIVIDKITFKLIGQVDRVDFEGDTLRIIDYKTGKVEEKEVTFTNYDEIIDDPKKAKAFQLLMYAYLFLKMNPSHMRADIVAGNFSFKNLKLGLLKLAIKKSGSKKEVLNIDNSVLDEFEKQLAILLNKIVNEDFEQTNDIKVCEWCDYKLICQRN